ncbi:MAG: hypothetical protein WAV45_02235 [Propionibacteriaceae bacterium]|nr:hypothetical protein [Micropruina sp.]HBY22803.1 hypothetical protein [Propionibacteriaceae bacterium]
MDPTPPQPPPQLLSVLSTMRANAEAAFPGKWTRCYLAATRHNDRHISSMTPLWVGDEEVKRIWLDDDAQMTIPRALLAWTSELAAAGLPVWHILVLGMNRVPGDYEVKLIYPGDPDDAGWEVDPRNTQPFVDKIVAAVDLPDPPPPTGWWRRLTGDRFAQGTP